MSADVFEKIANDLQVQGYSIIRHALPQQLTEKLHFSIRENNTGKFEAAGLGRKEQHVLSSEIRSDKICWIDASFDAGQQWLSWTADLQQYLNRRLYLGLFSFESHFAHYQPGAFYKKHIDAFRGESNRRLSLVCYLNPEWIESDGGELVLYDSQGEQIIAKVLPECGTIVVFLSEEFPHEVLPSNRDRFSIAGWFRHNTSHSRKVDPPE